MADLDSRSKRASSVQLLTPYNLALVLPDGTISTADRQHIVWMYSGITAVSPTPADRIWPIESETRVYPLADESRVWPIEAEIRVYEVTD
jgi:hypothetical protein